MPEASYKMAVAGANVKDFTRITMKDLDYATASNVKWFSNGTLVTDKVMTLGEKLTIQFDVDLNRTRGAADQIILSASCIHMHRQFRGSSIS